MVKKSLKIVVFIIIQAIVIQSSLCNVLESKTEKLHDSNNLEKPQPELLERNLSEIKSKTKSTKSKKLPKSIVKLNKFVKSHNIKLKTLTTKKFKTLLVGQKKAKSRKLWGWWHRLMARRRAIANAIRRENGAINRKRKSLLLKLKKMKIKQIDRNKFDALMEKARKDDSETWTRTFLYDAILLTEKLAYIEYKKLLETEMDLLSMSEAKAVSDLDKYYAKNENKKVKDLSPAERVNDIFM